MYLETKQLPVLPSKFTASAETLGNHFQIVGGSLEDFQIEEFSDAGGNSAESQLIAIHVQTLQEDAFCQILKEKARRTGRNDE